MKLTQKIQVVPTIDESERMVCQCNQLLVQKTDAHIFLKLTRTYYFIIPPTTLVAHPKQISGC